MEERRLRVGSVFEWAAAAAAVVLLIWVGSVPVQRLMGPRVEASLADGPAGRPPGVPAGAVNVPVLLLLDGRELRHGELHSRLEALLPNALAEGPAHVSASEFGQRHTRAYLVDGIRVYVVCEPTTPGGPLRVSGVYLP